MRAATSGALSAPPSQILRVRHVEPQAALADAEGSKVVTRSFVGGSHGRIVIVGAHLESERNGPEVEAVDEGPAWCEAAASGSRWSTSAVRPASTSSGRLPSRPRAMTR